MLYRFLKVVLFIPLMLLNGVFINISIPLMVIPFCFRYVFTGISDPQFLLWPFYKLIVFTLELYFEQ